VAIAALLVAFAAVTFSMPITDNTVKQIEARTQVEVKAIQQEGSIKPKVEKRIESELGRIESQAQKVANQANSADANWASGATEVKDQLKSAEHEAKVLMAEKQAVVTQKKMAMKMVDDVGSVILSHNEELGESGPAEDARIKAAEWKEGEALANAVAMKRAVETSPTDKMALAKIAHDEHKVDVDAMKEAKSIDAAGLALNKWYNAHEKASQNSLYSKSSDAELGEALNPAQQKIQEQAIASIKQVQEQAAKAMAAAANGNSPAPAKAAPTPAKAVTTDDKAFQKMSATVDKALATVASTATLDSRMITADEKLLH
jgi:hypothetical protein